MGEFPHKAFDRWVTQSPEEAYNWSEDDEEDNPPEIILDKQTLEYLKEQIINDETMFNLEFGPFVIYINMINLLDSLIDEINISERRLKK